jgi:hypothetical protein
VLAGEAERGVEVARAQALEVQRHVPVARDPHRRDHPLAQRHHVGEAVERHLEASRVAVVSHP